MVMDNQLAQRFQAHLPSDEFNLPQLMSTPHNDLPTGRLRDSTWNLVVVSVHGWRYKNALLDFRISNSNQPRLDLTVEGPDSGYKRSCRSNSCSSGHQTSSSHGRPSTKELLGGIRRHDAPKHLVPKPIYDATLEIAYAIDQMRGKGIFDPEVMLIEKVMAQLNEPAPFHHVEIISRLLNVEKIVAVHPTGDVRLQGYVSRIGEFSSHWEMAKAEGRDPSSWMDIRYLLPCPECRGTGLEQTPKNCDW